MWERRALQRLVWVAALLAIILVVNVVKTGQGPLGNAVSAVLLVVLGVAVGPELSRLVLRARGRLGGRSSSFGKLMSPQRFVEQLRHRRTPRHDPTSATRDGLGACESAAAKLREELERQCADPNRNRLTLIVCDARSAAEILERAFTAFRGFQLFIPDEGADGRDGVVRWLKTGSVELPPKLAVREPTVVLLDNFEEYRALGLKPTDFERWSGLKFAALGWLERPNESSWLNGFYPMATVIDDADLSRGRD